ncbi:MAG: TerC family protein, partial [Phycisphaerales bacterium]
MIWLWVAFLALIFVLLALDLGLFHRRLHAISIREAGVWTAVWVALALVFNVCVYLLYQHHVFGIGQVIGHPIGGGEAALDFFTGYLIEKSLSLDNIFVIALIFTYFRIPVAYQHRVLFWGIVGAVIFRGVMILLGAALIARFEWVTYVFGAILIGTAVKLLVTRGDSVHPDRNLFVRLARRMYPVSQEMDGPRFFTLQNGQRAVTPVFIAMLVVESSDVMFAVDSIPAIFAITRDPFIVFTSNIFAILGLRSLYFVLAGMLDRFRFMKFSLVVLLAFIGVKMLLAEWYHIPTPISLGAVCAILAAGVIVSLLRSGTPAAAPSATSPPDRSQ